MSIPLRVRIDWDKIKVCRKCAEKIVEEVKAKYDEIKAGKTSIDIVRILCDDCWKYNTSSGGITVELDPKILRD